MYFNANSSMNINSYNITNSIFSRLTDDKVTLEDFLDDEDILNEVRNPKNFSKLAQ